MPKQSVLEKIVKQISNVPNPSPFDIPRLGCYQGSWFDLGRVAIQVLDDPEEIKEFLPEYINYIARESGESVEVSEQEARRHLGYCTGYVSDERANIWFKTLPDISHPIMGRQRPFKKGSVVGKYFLTVYTTEQEIKDYVQDFLSDMLNGESFDVRCVSNEIDKDYATFCITADTKTLFGEPQNAYLFLTGIMQGFAFRIEDEFGKKCPILLDMLESVN